MVLVLPSRKWALLLWSLSGFVSNRTPFSCRATTKEKGSIFVSDGNIFQRNYQLEDFFWTGSGDGPVIEDSLTNETDSESRGFRDDRFDGWRTTTVFHTTTILFATVYPDGESCSFTGCKPKTSPVWTGSVEFSSPVFPSVPEIEPTPTVKFPDAFGNRTAFPGRSTVPKPSRSDFHGTPTKTVPDVFPSTAGVDLPGSGAGEGSGAAYPRFDVDVDSTVPTPEPDVLFDRRYWLLTVLKRENYSKELKIHAIEEKLSMLYRKAFIRQQEKHLGINGNSLTTNRPRRDRRIPEPVRVHIHNVTDFANNEVDGIGLLYSVTVAGKPVPALTAANDMKLITINEVVAELGYPVLTKAEPYLKGVTPLGARIKGRTRDTWLLIGAVIAAVSLLIILAIIFSFGLSNKRENNNSRNASNKKQVFEAEEGHSNLAFRGDSEVRLKSGGSKLRGQSNLDNSKTAENSAATTVTFADQRRGSTSSSSCSGSSEASLVRLRHQQRKKDHRKEVSEEKPRPRPRTRVRRVENADEVTEEARQGRISSGNRDSGMTTEGADDAETTPRLTRTPTSYLSMPSVKAFPRGPRIPEPLSRVLEPISIRYLDGDSENFYGSAHRKTVIADEDDSCRESERRTERGVTRHASFEDDPGVIGPAVWGRRYVDGQGILDVSGIDGSVNVGKMRKRFNDLVDDAFSMFGSRNDSPEDKSDSVLGRSTDGRIHSAVIRPAEPFLRVGSGSRPKTTDSKRPMTATNRGPRGAWDSPDCSTPSKQVASPRIDRNAILVDGNLPSTDPAVPLIKAIKDELHKFDRVAAKRPDVV
ncbi:UNVERIFIED_CONTAM: hypothetical protein PYX00_006066 [Menopon gallinae]|uniref:Transmembrane protein n=1 Tax=Menopon gallinae TaxID=328185 RepID=A0AAW2HUU7_9NEOP